MKFRGLALLFCLTGVVGWHPAVASEDAEGAFAENAHEETQVQDVDPNDPWVLAMQAAKHGPETIPLSNQGALALPQGYIFIPRKETATIMEMWGNSVDSNLQGMVISEDEHATWFSVIDYIASGYIKDDDAKDWDAVELLVSIKQGTAQQNEVRRERGIPEMEIIGWVQSPTYRETEHKLTYSISSMDKGESADAERGINYNTYVLGREGYFQLNLVTDLSKLEQDKMHASALLDALKFNDGRRYDQYNSATDHTAEYGLAALVAGAAAKKLGFFAAIGVFLLKFWKIALIGLVGAGALIKKVFFRSNAE